MMAMEQGSMLSRFAAFALLASLLLAAVFGIGLPVAATMQTLPSRLSDATNTLARFRLLEQQSTVLTTSSGGIEPYLADYLQGAEDAVIVAELQNRLRSIAIGSDVEVNSSSALPTKTIDGHAYLGVRISLRGQMKEVHGVLHAIETAEPWLFVERLAMHLDTSRLQSRVPGFEGAFPLIADVDVFGARLPAAFAEKKP